MPLLAESTVEVWLAETACAPPCATLAALLSEDERARAARRRNDEHRREFMLAHALVRLALSQHANVQPTAWRFRRGLHGRPEPEASGCAEPPGMSVSHTRGLVACAVGSTAALGVDVERARPGRDPVPVATRFFAPEESAELRALPRAARVGRFLELWTLKEAFVKACGLPLAAGLEDLRVAIDETGAPRIRFGPGCGEDPTQWAFALRAPATDVRLAVAVRTRGPLALRVRRGFPRARPPTPDSSPPLPHPMEDE